jgi:hypothetical protein
MKTDTPRTDAKENHCRCLNDQAWGIQGWKFAEQLERELTAVTEQRDRLQKIVDEQCRVSSVCREYREQRDRLAEVLQLFLNRVQYNSVFMDGKLRGGTFDYRSSGFDSEVEQAYKALAAVKGGSDE